MNREKRRKATRIGRKKRYSLEEIQLSLQIAANMKKTTKGHLYQKVMIDKKIQQRCVFCEAPEKAKKLCDYWVMTLLDRFQVVLINKAFYQEDDSEARWMRLENEYNDVKLPVVYAKD